MKVSVTRFGFAQVGELQWHYAAAGHQDEPLILFLHGFPEYWGVWRAQIEAFASQFHCVAPDLTGYNLSSKPKEVARYRTARLVDDVAAFAGLFRQKRKFTLVAHDWGGALAWAFAIKHPEQLDRLIIINAVHPGAFQREVARNPAQASASQYIHALRAPDAEIQYAADDYALLWRSFAEVEAAGQLSPELRAGLRSAWSQEGTLTGMFNWYRAMRLTPPRGADASAETSTQYPDSAMMVKVPTLVLWGLRDHALLPGCVEGLEQWVPDVTVQTFADYGHWISLETPDLVTGAMRAWLSGSSDGAGSATAVTAG
ncbi:MAG TPA: alpha/beta hydrolase [Alphaproteobacteria bacterium]|nr:alpha/beta hydrolase [Alphaproteobacteria bacterium]HAJ46503.1 alpha/beta hydrolase [Alphaproteobacteria bacterium]